MTNDTPNTRNCTRPSYPSARRERGATHLRIAAAVLASMAALVAGCGDELEDANGENTDEALSAACRSSIRTSLQRRCRDADAAATADASAPDTADSARADAAPDPEMLTRVNAARATARTCGTEFMPAVPPLTWDTRLEAAARVHSEDMLRNSYFSHTGSDGSQPDERVTAQGYSWSAVGENIAAGYADEAAAVAGWLASPGHCRNIMSPNYTQMGAAMVTGGTYGSYWTQSFARPL